MEVKAELISYIEDRIIPLYDSFDKAHRRDHVLSVIQQSLQLASYYEMNPDMVYTIAAYHDVGLTIDRPNHHLHSGRIIREDAYLNRWFNKHQIETMAQAVEDHRASNTTPPRSLYGKIVAEADRLIDPYTIIRRTIQYGLKYFPHLSREEHILRAIQHLKEKYAEGGYLKLWIPESPNAKKLQQFHELLRDEKVITKSAQQIFDEEVQN